MKCISRSEQSTLKDDRIIVKIPADNSKVKAIIEMETFDAWLDEFDILLLIQELFKGLTEEQKKNLLLILNGQPKVKNDAT